MAARRLFGIHNLDAPIRVGVAARDRNSFEDGSFRLWSGLCLEADPGGLVCVRVCVRVCVCVCARVHGPRSVSGRACGVSMVAGCALCHARAPRRMLASTI